MPTCHILIYGKQQALPFRLLALCHLTDQAWYSAPAPWCKAGGKVAWASRPAIPAVLAARRPMALGFDQHHPGGMSENSPAFQRWDRSQRTSSPAGTAEAAVVSRPFGTSPGGRAHPALKRWAILICPSGTGAAPRLPNAAYHSNPSDIGRDGRTTTKVRRPAGLARRRSRWVYLKAGQPHQALANNLRSEARPARPIPKRPIVVPPSGTDSLL